MKSDLNVGLSVDRNTAPLKIIHLANHVREIGNGIVNFMVDLACSQANAGHTVMVASAGGEYEALLARHGVAHLHLAQQPKPSKLLPMSVAFNRVVTREQPDIVHAHMMTGMLVARLVRVGRPYRLVSTVHNEFQRTAKVMSLADRVVAVGAAVATSMAARGVPATRLRTVANGTIGSPRRTIDAHASLPAPALRHPNIVTVAGMYHRKGIGVLLDAFSQIRTDARPAHLYLVGDGPDRAVFEAYAATLGIADRTHFVGFQPDVAGFLAQADVFTLASLRDPFPLVVIEAREAGCAIVASEVDGIPEALEFGAAGVLVQAGNPHALSDALQCMLSDDAAREAWKQRARTNLGWLDISRVNREYLSIYEEVIWRAQSSATSAPPVPVPMPGATEQNPAP